MAQPAHEAPAAPAPMLDQKPPKTYGSDNARRTVPYGWRPGYPAALDGQSQGSVTDGALAGAARGFRRRAGVAPTPCPGQLSGRGPPIAGICLILAWARMYVGLALAGVEASAETLLLTD